MEGRDRGWRERAKGEGRLGEVEDVGRGRVREGKRGGIGDEEKIR